MDEPRFDLEVVTESLQIVHQVIRGLILHTSEVVACPRGAPSAAALIQADDEVKVGIEPSTIPSLTETATRAAVEVHRRSAGGVARRLEVQACAVRAVEEARRERLQGRVRHLGSL